MTAIANMYAEKVVALIAEIKVEALRLQRLVSEVDRKVSDKYHEIERDKFDVVAGYRHSKELQDLLRKRRVLKGENARLQSLNHSLIFNESAFSKTCEKDEEIRRSQGVKMTLADVISEA